MSSRSALLTCGVRAGSLHRIDVRVDVPMARTSIVVVGILDHDALVAVRAAADEAATSGHALEVDLDRIVGITRDARDELTMSAFCA